MKSLTEKTAFELEDILNLINADVQEGTYLEFKDAGAFYKEQRRGANCKEEIGKDISAFANSDGGIIIYGLHEGKNQQAEKITYIDSIQFSKDWLQAVIEGNTKRPVTDLIIHPVLNPENSNEQIYVVVIKASAHAPHMAMDGKFYRRNNKGNVIMEEYEVRDMYYRTGKTDLEIVDIPPINLTELPHFQGNGLRSAVQATFNFYIRNIGQTIEHYYKLELHLTPGLLFNNTPPLSAENESLKEQRRENDLVVYAAPGKIPLFQNDILRLGLVNLAFDKTKHDTYKNGKIVLRLFYSHGSKEKTFFLKNILQYNSEPIAVESFTKDL